MKEHALENVMIKGAIPFNECRVLSAVVRLTVGFKQYQAVNLSYSDLAEATEIPVSGVKKAVSSLCKKRLLVKTRLGRSSVSKTRYRVNYDSADWKIKPLEPMKFRSENYEGCELSAMAENQAQSESTVPDSDPGTVPEKQTSTVPDSDPSTVPEKQTSDGQQTQTGTSSAAEDRKYDRKKKEKERKKHTAYVLDEHAFSDFLKSKEEVQGRESLGRRESLWQAEMFLEKFWRLPITATHSSLLERAFPNDESTHNQKLALSWLHDSAEAISKMNREQLAKGNSPVSDPIERSIKHVAARISDSYLRMREAAREKRDNRVESEDDKACDDDEYDGVDPETGKVVDPVAWRRSMGVPIYQSEEADDEPAEEAC